ncbi:MAG: MarR family winged helix-turn-helix transcriptional regulator [Fimbriiglobus sp.]
MTETKATAGTTAARFDSPAQEAYLSLWRTYDRLRAIEDELFAGYGLTAQQYNALRLLKAAHPGTIPTLTLADRLVSRAPDITRMVDRLEQLGHAGRERSPTDRRAVLVRITPAGLTLLEQMADPVQACNDRQLGHLSPAELKKLVALLRAARGPHEPDGSGWK